MGPLVEGTNLCRVVEGAIESCTSLTNDLVILSSLDGSVETGVAWVLGPFLFGLIVGAAMKMLGMAHPEK